MKVDIIIRAKDGHRLTANCVDSIRRNTPPGTYRIILVDDGSEYAYHPSIADVLIRRNEARGAVSATNLGLSVALLDQTEAPYVAVLDNDVEVPDGDTDWIERFVAELEAGGPKTACVGATTARANAPQHILSVPQTYTADFVERERGKDGKEIPDGRIRSMGWKDNPPVVWFISFACLMRKQAVVEVGFWDERFDPGNYEDTDYAVRLREAGWEIRVARSVYLHHHCHATFGARLVELLETNGAKFREKHGAGKLFDLGIMEFSEVARHAQAQGRTK